MARVLTLLTIAGLASALVPPAVSAQSELPAIPPAECAATGESRIPLLLVGSYHMSNPGADMFNLESDDVLSDRRQEEILAVVDRLEAFGPTRVAVEAPWRDSTMTARWHAYVNGTGDLRRAEEEQIGFRLAQRAGLDIVHGVDARVAMSQEGIGQVIQQAPQFGRNMQEVQEVGQWAVGYMADRLASGTIGEMLNTMNTPEALEMAHMPYIGYLTPIVHEETYGGADMVGDWYKRNLRIFANITRISEPGDRVFVIYGQGHIPTLRDFATHHPDFCLVDPLPFLE